MNRVFPKKKYLSIMLRVIQHIVLIPLLISAIMSLKSFRSGWPVSYRVFSILLWTMIVLELFAAIWKELLYELPFWSFTNSNHWIYNLSFFLQYPLYFYFFYSVFDLTKIKRNIVIVFIFFFLFMLLNYFFLQGVSQLNTYTMVFADLVTVILSIRYFNEVRNKDEIVRLDKNPMIWIMLGIFINHSVNIPYTLGMPYFWLNYTDLAIAFFYVYSTINCIMLILFSKAYLCPTPRPN